MATAATGASPAEPLGEHAVAEVAVGEDARGVSVRTSTDEMRWSRMTRAASTTVASGPTQTGGPRHEPPHLAGEVGLEGRHRRLLQAGAEPLPEAGGEVGRRSAASSSSRRNTAAGSSQATRSSSTTTSSVALPVMRDV